MIVQNISSQEELNAFVGAQAVAQFLQSWEWGEFQKSIGRNIWRWGVFDNNKIVGSASVIKQTLPAGKSYLYCPRGPVIDRQLFHPSSSEAESMTEETIINYQSILQSLLNKIVEIGKRQKALFTKIEPPVEKKKWLKFEPALQHYRSRHTLFVQPQDTWLLDLRQDQRQLLQAMHPKTRYNIRLAERKGVTVRQGNSSEDFATFWKLIETTVARDQFVAHAKEYYEKMFVVFQNTDFLKLYIAEYEGLAIAANLVISYGDTVTYLHGASANQSRNVMAPHLLQWRQIVDARQAGKRYYDFWGVAPAGTPREKAWQGITRFKKGFGGRAFSYSGAVDLILRPGWYRLYKVAQGIWR